MTLSIKIRKNRSKTKRKGRCLLYFLTVISNETTNTINWTEIILMGLFTLAGATLGAFLAGKYAVNAVKNQLNYDKKNKRMDMLNNHLKIGVQFLVKLGRVLSDIETFEASFLPITTEKGSTNQKSSIESAYKLIANIENEKKDLSMLPMDNLSYEDYVKYQSSLNDLDGLITVCTLLATQKTILVTYDKSPETTKEELEKSYDKFLELKNKLKEIKKEIDKLHNSSYKEYKKLESSITKMIKY